MLLTALLLLHITATSRQSIPVYARDGDDVILPCNNGVAGQTACEGTNWLFIHEYQTVLVADGKIARGLRILFDSRLSLTERCSLVINKVSGRNAGTYVCQHYKSGRDTQISLSVLTFSQLKRNDLVKVVCTETTDGRRLRLRWLYEGQRVADALEVQTSSAPGSAEISMHASHILYNSRYKSLQCAGFDDSGMQQFMFSTPFSENEATAAIRLEKRATTADPRTPRKVEPTTPQNHVTTAETTPEEGRADCRVVAYTTLALRVAEILMVTAVTVLLFRARGLRRAGEDGIVLTAASVPPAKHHGLAVSQDSVDNANYENTPSNHQL